MIRLVVMLYVRYPLSLRNVEFRNRYLSNPEDPDAFEGPVAVFDGPEDYHARIDDPAAGVTADTLLVMRGAGPTSASIA